MRIVLIILLSLAQTPSSADSQPLPHTQRVFRVAPQVLDSVKTMVKPVAPSGRKGSVVIAFWTSEQGAVVSARGIQGSPELQRAAIDAVYQWKFYPSMMASGQFVQMGTAAIVDFSKTPPAIVIKPMPATQVSPGFQFKCYDGMVHEDPASVDVCRQQLATIQNDSQSTPMDRFTALDQYGLVLMKYSHDPKKAAELFSQAIALAPERLKSSDPEWAYAYWHRAAAEQQLGNNSDAEKDFAIAENSLQEVAKGMNNEKAAAYYHALLASVAKQHAALSTP
jgi:tetratricopeptide (TPR) repeat protein